MISQRDHAINRIKRLIDTNEDWVTPADIIADLMHYCDWLANDLSDSSGDWETSVEKAWKYFYDDIEWDTMESDLYEETCPKCGIIDSGTSCGIGPECGWITGDEE